MAKPSLESLLVDLWELSGGQIKCNGRLLTSDQREQKAHLLLSTATYGHKQVAAGYWHLLLALLGE